MDDQDPKSQKVIAVEKYLNEIYKEFHYQQVAQMTITDRLTNAVSSWVQGFLKK